MCFEQCQLALVVAICGWMDSSKPCPRRCPLQASCGNFNCQNCSTDNMNLAGLTPQHLAGAVGKLISNQIAAVSGRRRQLQTQEHLKMAYCDVDMDRFGESDNGKKIFYFISPQGVAKSKVYLDLRRLKYF